MSSENYIGVTTGTIATASALAALETILYDKDIHCVKVETPKETLDIFIDKCEKISPSSAKASAHKNPYNDPDVTVGLEIIANVELVDDNSQNKIFITGGKGIGKITKPGLQIPVGEYAINPVPREMIKKNLECHVPDGKLAKVTISIPKGVEIAKKTMNPKLGIVGGISVLGTTGIARSMSTEAYKNSILTQLDVAVASNIENLVFVPGNIGEKLAIKKLGIDKTQIIQTGNYIGFMFEQASKRGINNFTFFGHIGKLIKVAGGIFDTKHSVADGRKEIMICHAAINKANFETLTELYGAKTTEEMLDILKNQNLDGLVADSIADAIKQRCYLRFNININVILVDMEGNYLNNNY